MPLKVKLTRVVDIVIAVAIALLLVSVILFMFTIRMSTSVTTTDDSYVGSTEVPDDTDAVTGQLHYNTEYYSYKNRLDSIERKRNLLLQPLHLTEGFFGNGVFGMAHYTWCDTCDYSKNDFFYEKQDNRQASWLVLYGYTAVRKDALDQRNGIDPLYYGYKGQLYKAWVQWDSTHQKKHTHNDFGHWTRKPVRYSIEDPLQKSTDGTKNVLVQLSDGAKNLFYGISILWILLMLTLFLLCVRNIIQVLVQISVGNAFSLVNCNRLRYAAYSILLMSVITLLSRIILYLCVKSRLDGDWAPNMDWGGTIIGILAGMGVWLVARAFLKGYKIQQEQDLTI